MIFVILGGVVEFDFSRILMVIDELVMENNLIDNDIVAQIGYTKYEPKNYKWFRFVDGKIFDNYIEESNIIISHGGVGSLIKAMNKEKKIIVFPRLEKNKEHLDNHQMEIASKLANDGYLKCALNKEELLECIKGMDDFNPKQFHSDNELMLKIIYNAIYEWFPSK